METLYLGLTLGTLGKLILGIAVLRVHAYILREHSIDNVVLNAIRKERYVTAFAVLMMIVGYVLEMYFYANTPIVGL